MTQWQKLLRSLGFTESEARIYLSTLEVGPSSVQDIAKKTKVSRVTAYAAIESLMASSLMSTVEKGKKKLYASESPDRLLSFMQGRLKHMEATLRDVEASVQELKLLQRGERPVVKVFEGPEALSAIQSDMLQTRPAILDEFANKDAIEAMYDRSKFISPHQERFAQLKTKVRAVYATSRELKKVNPDSKLITLDARKHDFTGDIIVYDDKVALSTFSGKQISVLIESAEIAKTFRALFDEYWKDKRG